MPGLLVHVGAPGICPHGGQISVISSNTRVFVQGAPVATLADNYPIAACLFQIPTPVGPKPQPCVRVQWLVPATRVFVNGAPVILQASGGLCLSVEQIPQGPPTMFPIQTRVLGI